MNRRRVWVFALLVTTATFAIVGCTSTVRPPAGPFEDPVVVLLAFDDRHRGVLMQRDEARWVEYGFGDFAWYGEMRDAWYHVFPTVLWPTRGALGRRELRARDVAGVRRALGWVELEEIVVARQRAEALLDSLDRRFEAGRDGLVQNPTYRMEFVPDPDSYWCLFNCNDAVAQWLEQLGCSVSWVPIRLDLEVRR